jgi:hypothetical protein
MRRRGSRICKRLAEGIHSLLRLSYSVGIGLSPKVCRIWSRASMRERTICLWDPSTGKPLGGLTGHRRSTLPVATSKVLQSLAEGTPEARVTREALAARKRVPWGAMLSRGLRRDRVVPTHTAKASGSGRTLELSFLARCKIQQSHVYCCFRMLSRCDTEATLTWHTRRESMAPNATAGREGSIRTEHVSEVMFPPAASPAAATTRREIPRR